MKVFKFGGASVKDAAAVKNVASILDKFAGEKIVVVVSAMGKVTNALEEIHRNRIKGEKTSDLIKTLKQYHDTIAKELFGDNAQNRLHRVHALFEEMNEKIGYPRSTNEDADYDAIVSYGELFSTALVHEYLSAEGFNVAFADARQIIRTDNRFRDARVDWGKSGMGAEQLKAKFEKHDLIIIQGFIGSDAMGAPTTLGREGSDFTAAILAYLLHAENVTIWKDVPGMLNADPKWFADTIKLDKISFKEAIELAYYGASVIHPKTIKPLQNKNIPLFIKSFIHPEAIGSVIQEDDTFDHLVPSFICKANQLLLSIIPKDFSFVVEDNLREIFDFLSQTGIRIHLMENSALNFSICIDKDDHKFNRLLDLLKPKYNFRFNENLHLLTARHYTEENIKMLIKDKEVLLEQRNRQTIRFVVRPVAV